ncbi:hypothetical protein [Bordetella petrii]|uniref:hypothetical protein n=1 Tax=Bordetella petrii TaxID=94624 RepID=UPI0004919589|nr:hypothetical protein [Bordetella petrii]
MSYAEEAAAVSRQEPERHDRRMCCVAGCPMPGTTTDATNGSGDWQCTYHHGAQYSQQGGITTRIRNRQAMLVLATRLSNADAALLVPAEVRDWLRKRHRRDFADAPVRTARQLGAKMLSVLDREIRAPQQEVKQEKPQGRESWTNARTLLEGLA